MASCSASGPGSMCAKAMMRTKRSIDSQWPRSTILLYIMVICATGPPILIKPRSRKYRKTSRAEGMCSSWSFAGTVWLSIRTPKGVHQDVFACVSQATRGSVRLQAHQQLVNVVHNGIPGALVVFADGRHIVPILDVLFLFIRPGQYAKGNHPARTGELCGIELPRPGLGRHQAVC